MPKARWLILVILLMVLVGSYFTIKERNIPRPLSQIIQPTGSQLPSPIPTPTPRPSLTPPPQLLVSPTVTKTSPPTSSLPEGQITCSYQIPAAPNRFGTAEIVTKWGSVGVQACVSANGGGSQVVFTGDKIDGSRTDTINWISLNTEYIFTLYNTQGGSLPTCSGHVLATCSINTK